MTPEERAKNTIKEFREKLRSIPSVAQYMDCLEQILIEEFGRAAFEEREACAQIPELIAIGVPMVVSVSTHYHEREMESLKSLIAEKIRARSNEIGEGKSQ